MKHFNTTRGFTIIDLLVAAGVVMIVSTFVLANLRRVDRNNLPLALQQVGGGIVETQTMGLAGKLFSQAQPIYPTGGYGIIFQKNTSQYTIFGDLDSVDGNGTAIAGGVRGLLAGNTIIGVHYSLADAPPAIFTGWLDAPGDLVRLVFNQGETVAYFSNETQPANGVIYVGLKLRSDESGRLGFVYVSLKTGLLKSGFIP